MNPLMKDFETTVSKEEINLICRDDEDGQFNVFFEKICLIFRQQVEVNPLIILPQAPDEVAESDSEGSEEDVAKSGGGADVEDMEM